MKEHILSEHKKENENKRERGYVFKSQIINSLGHDLPHSFIYKKDIKIHHIFLKRSPTNELNKISVHNHFPIHNTSQREKRE